MNSIILKTVRIFAFLITICFIQCGPIEQVETPEKRPAIVKDKVDIVITNIPSKSREYKKGNSGPYTVHQPQFSYIDDNGIYRNIILDTSYVDIEIPTIRDIIELGISKMAFEQQILYANRGDSILIKYADKAIEISNLKSGEDMSGLSTSLESADGIHAYKALDKLKAPMHFVDLSGLSPSEFQTAISEFQEVTVRQAQIELNQLVDVTTKVHEKKLITNTEFNFRMLRLSGLAENYNLEFGDDSNKYKHADEPYQLHYFDKVNREVFNIGKQFPMLKMTNGSLQDFPKIYDAVSKAEYDKSYKKSLHRLTLDNIARFFSADKIEPYMTRYIDEYRDTTFVDYLKSAHRLNFESDNSILELVNLSGERSTLNQVIRSSQAELIYVDFWASWCKPCREAFPAGRKLKVELADYPIDFIYVGVKDQYKNWRTACQKEDIPANKSYLAENDRTSKFVQEHELFAIPRYMIFNRKGELLHARAFGPGDAAKEMLLKLLE